jgi:hypothetical protein
MKIDFRLSRAGRRGDLGDASVTRDARPLSDRCPSQIARALKSRPQVPRDPRVALVA